MFGPIMRGIGIAASPMGRRAIRGAIHLARSDEGRRVIAQARKVATGPESRRMLGEAAGLARRVGRTAADPETRARVVSAARHLRERR